MTMVICTFEIPKKGEMYNSRNLRSIIFGCMLFLITFSMAENLSWSRTNVNHQFINIIDEIREHNARVYLFWSCLRMVIHSVILLCLYRFIHSPFLKRCIILLVLIFVLIVIIQILENMII